MFNLYLSFIGRNQGYRASAMSYSELCSYHNSNYASGVLCTAVHLPSLGSYPEYPDARTRSPRAAQVDTGHGFLR